MKKLVLIVEDSFDNRAVYSEILRHAGYTVVEATNGEEGVAQALARAPDLILLDLSMPVMDGWAAVRVLKSHPKTADIPVWALSAHVILGGDSVDARAAGFDRYLTKPIEPKVVLAQIRESIGDPGVSRGSDSERSTPSRGYRKEAS